MKIDNFEIGFGPTFTIAEIGANHEQNYQKAVALIYAAKEAGANAVKLQTYTPEDLTIDCDKGPFVIEEGLGESLFSLYKKAAMPLSWHKRLKEIADDIGITLFSTPFSVSAVDFLEKEIDPPCYKIASPEINDTALWERIAETGKPVFFSTGCSRDYPEIIQAARIIDRKKCIPLHCISKYPARPEEMCLRTIAALSQSWGVHVGLSCHSPEIAIPIAAVALDARVIEAHIKLPCSTSPDAGFSITPDKFKEMVVGIRAVEKAVSGVKFRHQSKLKRSLFIVKDMKKGDEFTCENVKSIRPSGGIEPKELPNIIGKKANQDISYGTPLSFGMIT